MKLKLRALIALALLTICAGVLVAARLPGIWMGKQPDGSFVVSSGQRIPPGTIPFNGRPVDLALHPDGRHFAVLNQNGVLLGENNALIGEPVSIGEEPGWHGMAWSADGTHLYVSHKEGHIQILTFADNKLTAGAQIPVKPADYKENAYPGGIALTRDNRKLFVAVGERNVVAEVDLEAGRMIREYPVQVLPYDVRLSEDEKSLIVSNWGGRQPVKDVDLESRSASALLVVDPRGVSASGTVSLIDRESGNTTHLVVGNHPSEIVVRGSRAYVANAASDTISELDIPQHKVVRTIPIRWGSLNIFGSMPNALAISPNGHTLYTCNGGDNALCEVDLTSGKVRGFRQVGYYPTAVKLTPDGQTAFVVNTKGNGSVRNTLQGRPGGPHDFQGTVTILDLTGDLEKATAEVAGNNGWNRTPAQLRPKMAVYSGAIKHVLYIIKENMTYDEVFGDLPIGNGDPKLCRGSKQLFPNHRALAEEFTLFDNGNVSGTNSSDGHAWSNQAIANDYQEHNYTAGWRTYPDDGDCAMSRSAGGNLWDVALRKHKSVRIYGEYCDEDLAKFTPMPNSWLDMWKDREAGTHKYKVRVDTLVPSIKNLIHPEVVYWPLLQSDQARADLFIDEYSRFSKQNKVPDLMVLCLPCDHTEGLDPKYPKPRSMMADNDLALGRVVEAITKSPQWKDTCIFVIEDDGQAAPDHVDGHRTVYMAISPYTRRHSLDSSFQTTVSMLRSIELMLGLDPMCKLDAITPPITSCFLEKADLTPFTHVPNAVRLDDMNAPLAALQGEDRYWAETSAKLDWSGLDKQDPPTMRRVLWHSLYGSSAPYPAKD